MTETTLPSTEAELAQLREDNRKLRKINAALIDRVERSSDMAGNAFSMFETAITLEAMVRERTTELEDALGRLATANADLAQAHASAEAAQVRLRDAIDSINEGFVLFDAEDRLVLFNDAYLGFWPEIADQLHEGMSFEDVARLAAAHHRPPGSVVAPDRWVSDRLARHSVADGGHVQALADDRWVQINELRTSEGGIVGIYTDITEVKAEDARNRALELAERNLVLQSTLDNLSEGVCLFDAQGRVAAWNEALQHVLDLPDDWAQEGASHGALLDWCRDRLGMADGGCLDWRGDQPSAARHALVAAGDRHFEVRSTALERGGQVIGFTDVTVMLRAQAGLQETAETLERRVAERTAELRAEVAERREIEAQLRDAKTAAEKANLSKTSFLAAASHDLLQPLNAARLFVAALGDRRLALPTRALVNQTSTALDSVEDLLEALLEISRLDAGAIQPEIGDFRLDTLLGTLRVEFAPVARASGLVLDMASEPLWVRSDIRLVRRILQNFLSNALRYTQQGSVRLDCLVGERAIRVSVTDSGPGIAADKQALVFEEFRRLDTRTSGKGLGLAIVKRASDMLGHRVTLESAPGRGSTFAIDLPTGEPVADLDNEPEMIGRDRSMRGLNVLVIDNERAIQTGMRTLLGGWGCTVLAAGGFAEATGLFTADSAPDIILIDYHLNEGETGDVALDRLRDHFAMPVPAVMISADRGKELKARLDAHGIPLLNKPVKPAQLRALLRTMLK
ncbi:MULTISPECIES: hybrid sensor histidine kinase/response regulator [Sphingobium]|uniref:histidine kinase n=1 Tax=Sphingobium cupriresistens LL01 TaxID=1420583 RepID=A0A0J8AQN4_9SPHN|nr:MULTISPECIES: NahK/ErcS family hybrid sensor histidine kinase/response regulator [Sphingobium]KMS56725.1 histidine kinase [Sphingobium cupriresistens LL01]MBJ7377308.1 PAS-domain containing protein [Sphingobium sp.]